MKKIKVGSDFSGVGAFDQALKRLGVNYETVFACDMDKYARDTFIHNYGEPKYYPTNVYDREIPTESLDIYMTSPPCQAFSLAGKRLGKDDKRGVLFFNSHEFIQVNKPRFFIFENVKGLLSDDGGKTFQEWINMLGGKSVNGLPVLFAHDDAVPYHLYWKVLNAKHHGVPQNRERVFLIGIRDDKDNNFQYPREEHLMKRLKDVLEEEIFEKYYLSDERIGTITNAERGIGWTDADTKNTANCVLTGYAKNPTDGEYLKVKSNLEKYFLSEKMLELITFQEKTNGEIANLNKGGERGSVYDSNTDSISCLSATDYKQPKQILINSATSKGYEEAREGDSINFSVPNSETRRVGKGVAQTLDTGCNQATMDGFRIRRLTPRECFRLMDFPDSFTWNVSDSQAYKQAGNSIVVNVLYKILKQLPL
jgi:DNA (cytosine-5)-methyltransferase 1